MMKSKIVTSLLLCSAIFGSANWSCAETCYATTGSVATENVTPTLQLGSISLTLSDRSDNPVFSETGSLAGNITGTEGPGTTLLSHRAKFKGGKFITNSDKAVLVYPYVRRVAEDGVTPCSFWIQETISNISQGKKFFRGVTDVKIVAKGYISNCSDENSNQFELSGRICVE